MSFNYEKELPSEILHIFELPPEYKKTDLEILFSLNQWVRVSIREDFNNYKIHLYSSFNYYSSLKAIWDPLIILIKNGGFKTNLLGMYVKEFIYNILFSFVIFSYKITSVIRKKSLLQTTHREKAIHLMRKDYLEFIKREKWYNFDFIIRLIALLKFKNKLGDENINFDIKDSLLLFSTILKLSFIIILSYPFIVYKKIFKNIDDLYMVLEFLGTERIEEIDSFNESKYVGTKNKSIYVKVPRYRDLSIYINKLEQTSKLISISDVTNLLVSCYCHKSFPIENLLNAQLLFSQEFGDNQKRYIFKIQVCKARAFLRKIEDTPVRLEGYINF